MLQHRSIKDILEQCDLDEILKDSTTQLHEHNTNNELSGDNDSTSNHSSETRESSGASHGKHWESLFDVSCFLSMSIPNTNKCGHNSYRSSPLT